MFFRVSVAGISISNRNGTIMVPRVQSVKLPAFARPELRDNPSIERPSSGMRRMPRAAAHVERQAPKMRSLISLFPLLFAVAAHGQSMSNAKSESEDLMNAAVPFAEEMLQKHGEFFPYGQALNSQGQVVAVAAHDGREHPPSAEVIRLLKQGFVQGAMAGKYKATALVYDVRVQLPSTGMKSDAIAVSLNHKDNYSVIVFFAYKLEGSKLVMGEVFATKGEMDVFTK
jgi:hypothetical protein